MDYNARYYSPYLNRFIQPDSIIPNLYNPQSLNRFTYTSNNPINRIDPTGHDDECDKYPEGDYRSCACIDDPLECELDSLEYDKDESALVAFLLVWLWFFEGGPDTYTFTLSDSFGMDVYASPGMQEFREVWAEAGYPVPFEWSHTIDTRDGTGAGLSIDNIKIYANEQIIDPMLVLLGEGSDTVEGQIDMVGGVIGSLDQINVTQYDENNVLITVTNTMGWASALRHPGKDTSIVENVPRNNMGSNFGFGGTIQQIFNFIIPNP